MWHLSSIFVQLVDVFCSYRVTISARNRTAAGLLLWLARWSGTLSRTISGIQIEQLQVSAENVFCFQHTGAISAIDVLRRCALQIYILLTLLSYYLLFHGWDNCYRFTYYTTPATNTCRAVLQDSHVYPV